MIICLCLLFAGRASAQWVVSDPGNLAQGIINASKNIIHTSKTATNMMHRPMAKGRSIGNTSIGSALASDCHTR